MKAVRKRLKEIEEEIYNICFREKHSEYKTGECPYCNKFEKLIIEKKKLTLRLYYGR
jgi:hypothetical protein